MPLFGGCSLAWLPAPHPTGGRGRTLHPHSGHDMATADPSFLGSRTHARCPALPGLSWSPCPVCGQGRDSGGGGSAAWGRQAGRMGQALLGWHEGLVGEPFAWLLPRALGGMWHLAGRGAESLPPPKCPGCSSPWVLSSCIALHQWPQIWTVCVSLGLNRKWEEGRRKQAVTV